MILLFLLVNIKKDVKGSSKYAEYSNMKKFILVTSLAFSFLYTLPTFADTTYKVQKGDTLFSISRKNEITIDELRAANNLAESDIIKIGQTIIIPSPDISNAAALTKRQGATSTPLSTNNKTNSTIDNKNTEDKNSNAVEKKNLSPTTPSIKTSIYIVEKGDTLYGIARKSNIKLSELLSLNNIDTTTTIKIGQKILIPYGSISSTPTAIATKTSDKKTQTIASDKKNINKTSDKSKSIAQNSKKDDLKVTSINTTGVVWPLQNPKVKSISGKVSGVELIGKDNEVVKSVREGTVMYTGLYRGFGEVIFVQSKTGLIYSYTGLKKVDAKKGDYITLGTPLGSTGDGKDASIKFMVFQNGLPVNPATAPRG